MLTQKKQTPQLTQRRKQTRQAEASAGGKLKGTSVATKRHLVELDPSLDQILKVMAAVRGIPKKQLLQEIVQEAIDREKDQNSEGPS